VRDVVTEDERVSVRDPAIARELVRHLHFVVQALRLAVELVQDVLQSLRLARRVVGPFHGDVLSRDLVERLERLQPSCKQQLPLAPRNEP